MDDKDMNTEPNTQKHEEFKSKQDNLQDFFSFRNVLIAALILGIVILIYTF